MRALLREHPYFRIKTGVVFLCDVSCQIGRIQPEPSALDAAHRIIAVLDRMDGDPDLEDSADAEPSLAPPENTAGSQVVYMRGSGWDGEAEAPKTFLPEVEASPIQETTVIHVKPLCWGSHGNVVSTAGLLIVDLFKRA